MLPHGRLPRTRQDAPRAEQGRGWRIRAANNDDPSNDDTARPRHKRQAPSLPSIRKDHSQYLKSCSNPVSRIQTERSQAQEPLLFSTRIYGPCFASNETCFCHDFGQLGQSCKSQSVKVVRRRTRKPKRAAMELLRLLDPGQIKTLQKILVVRIIYPNGQEKVVNLHRHFLDNGQLCGAGE